MESKGRIYKILDMESGEKLRKWCKTRWSRDLQQGLSNIIILLTCNSNTKAMYFPVVGQISTPAPSPARKPPCAQNIKTELQEHVIRTQNCQNTRCGTYNIHFMPCHVCFFVSFYHRSMKTRKQKYWNSSTTNKNW